MEPCVSVPWMLAARHDLYVLLKYQIGGANSDRIYGFNYFSYNHCRVAATPSRTKRGLANLRYVSLIACISMTASCMSIRSLGCCFEQDIPSAMTETKQFSILLLVVLL